MTVIILIKMFFEASDSGNVEVVRTVTEEPQDDDCRKRYYKVFCCNCHQSGIVIRNCDNILVPNLRKLIRGPVDRLVKSAASVTRLGEFLQVLGTKLSPESSPNILVTFWAFSYNVTCFKICAWLLFGQFLGEIKQFFIPSSGYTECC